VIDLFHQSKSQNIIQQFMRSLIIIILVFGQFRCFSQEHLKQKETITFTNVECLLLINYTHELSSGVNYYNKYVIKRRAKDFLIEATSGKRELYPWTVPLSKSEIEKNTKTVNDKQQSKLFIKSISDNYFSEKLTYKIGNNSYIVYKHINYNCYDPQCGTKHNHTTFVSGETYFSPDFGILLSLDNRNLEFNILYKIKEKKVPSDLILHILKERKTDNKIVQEYIRKISKQ
jgi:hypothetical protein